MSADPRNALAIENPRPCAHMANVSRRALFAILIAFGMLFAPLVMQTGGVMAMTPGDHQSQMMEKGHCDDPSASSGVAADEMGKSCCIAMCPALAVTAPAPVDPLAFARILDRPSLNYSHRDHVAKLATPPPRRA